MHNKNKFQSMKSIILSVAIIGLLFSCNQTPEKTEEKIELGEAYGPVAVDIKKAVSIPEFFSDFEQQESSGEYTIEGNISEICAKAGCWVGVDKGNGDYFMVRFKDHFTIPIDTKLGTGAYIHGVATWDSITVEQLKHTAYTEGKSKEEIDAITQPEYSFGFLADGIILKK